MQPKWKCLKLCVSTFTNVIASYDMGGQTVVLKKKKKNFREDICVPKALNTGILGGM